MSRVGKIGRQDVRFEKGSEQHTVNFLHMWKQLYIRAKTEHNMQLTYISECCPGIVTEGRGGGGGEGAGKGRGAARAETGGTKGIESLGSELTTI